MNAPDHRSVDERLTELTALLHERAEGASPITQAEAMEFCRNAYMAGYTDGLTEPLARRVERVR